MMRRGLLVLLLPLLAAACAGPPVWETPRRGSVRFPALPSPHLAAAGPRLAVQTLEDARPRTQREALSSWLEEQDGYTGEAVTRDVAWPAPVARLASDALAAHLAATGRFGAVRRIDAGEAPQAEYVLTGRLRRLRGWQAYRVEKDAPPRVLEALGDVFIDRIEIVERATGRLVFVGQVGALIETPPAVLDPYALAHAAFGRAAEELASEVSGADLARADLARKVRLEPGEPTDLAGLLRQPPQGWVGAAGGSAAPFGWDGGPGCATAHLEDRTRWFFHPRLGRYHPWVDLWVCPSGYRAHIRLSGPDGARFPATFLGLDGEGRPVFVRSLGATSWPGAEDDVSRALGLSRPAGAGPVLEVPAAP